MSEDNVNEELEPTYEELKAELDKVKVKLEKRTADVARLKQQGMTNKTLLIKAQGDLKKEKEKSVKFLDAYNNMRHKFDFLQGLLYVFDERGDLVTQIKYKSFGEVGANYKLSKKLQRMFKEYMGQKFTYFMDRKASQIKKNN